MCRTILISVFFLIGLSSSCLGENKPPIAQPRSDLETLSRSVETLTTSSDEEQKKKARTVAIRLDKQIYNALWATPNAPSASRLVELAYQRSLGSYADPSEIYDRLLASPPQTVGSDLVNVWLDVLQDSTDRVASDSDNEFHDKLWDRFRRIDAGLESLAASGTDDANLAVLVRLAQIRAASQYADPLKLIDLVLKSRPADQLPEVIRIAVSRTYLQMNLVYEATKAASAIDRRDPQAAGLLAGIAYASDAARAMAVCVDRGIDALVHDEVDRSLLALLTTSGLQGSADYEAQPTDDNSKDRKKAIANYCKERKANGVASDWIGLFDVEHKPVLDTTEHQLAPRILPVPLQAIPISKPVAAELKAINSQAALSDELAQRLLKTISVGEIIRPLLKAADMAAGDAKQVTIVDTKKLDGLTLVQIRTGDSYGADFLIFLNGTERLPYVAMTGSERYLSSVDITRDGSDEIIVEQYDTTARFLTLNIIDVKHLRSFNVGKPQRLYRGLFRLVDFDGSGNLGIMVGAMHQARLLTDCNQCPGEYSYYVYEYNPADDSLAMRAQHNGMSQIRDPKNGGLMGINLGASLGFSRREHEAELRTFETHAYRSDDAQQAENDLGSIMQTVSDLIEAGDLQTANEEAHRALTRMEALRTLGPWAPILIAKARVEWASALLKAGDDAAASKIIDDPDVRDTQASGKIPGLLVAQINALASYGLGDLTKSIAANEQIMSATGSDLYGLTGYGWFLAEIGETAEAKILAQRIISDTMNSEAMVLLATLNRDQGPTDDLMRLLHRAMADARSTGDANVTTAVLFEAAKLAAGRNNHDLAERFFVSAFFEASNEWWRRHGTEFLVDLGRNLAAKGNLELARRVWAAATGVGAATDARFRSMAFYEIASHASGEDRFTALRSAYDAATKYRGRIPGEGRKINFVESTDRIADEFFAEASARSLPPDEILGLLEQWRFQVFNEIYRSESVATDAPASDLGARIRSYLQPTDFLIVYYIGAKTAFAVTADREASRVTALDLDPVRARKAVAQVRQHFDLGNPASREMISRDRVTVGLRQDLEALHASLLQPLNIPADATRLIIVPDKALQGVPWPALSARAKDSRIDITASLGFAHLAPAASTYSFNILPSALLLSTVSNGTIDSAVFVASAAALPAQATGPELTEADRKAIGPGALASLAGTSAEVATAMKTIGLEPAKMTNLVFPFSVDGKAIASSIRDRVLASLPGRSVVHIAAHGIFNAQEPMASFLLLDAKRAGGLIRASDFLHVNLGANEVTLLTACDSGEVLVQAGNEVMGFQRALFAAGAKRLILTNWLVDDRVSTEYTSAFYRALAEHLSVEAAHRRAIDRLRQRFSHPYFWAGYMLSSRD